MSDTRKLGVGVGGKVGEGSTVDEGSTAVIGWAVGAELVGRRVALGVLVAVIATDCDST